MNDQPRKTLLGIPLWVFALAGLIGVLIGSFRQVQDVIERPESEAPLSVEAPERRVDESTDDSSGDSMTIIETRSTPVEQGVQFRATDGLVFEPARINGSFIGFRVISNRDDDRVEIGDIVVSVNGMPVEDSAAGSELFIASLSNPDATLELHQVSDGER